MYYWMDATKEERAGEKRLIVEGLDSFSGLLDDASAIELADTLSEAQNANNPERQVIRRDSFRRLSNEAVEVFDVMLNIPSELLGMITGKRTYKRLTLSDVRRYMIRERGWPGYLIDNTLVELKGLARSFLG